MRTVPGFGPRSEEKILEALDRAPSPPAPLLLHEALALGDRLVAHLRALPSVREAEVAGSLRRGVEQTSAIDLVAASDDPDAVVEHLLRFPLLAAVVSRDADGCEAALPDGVPVTLRVAPPAAYAGLLHRVTGSAAHLARLGAIQRARGAGSRALAGSPKEPADAEIYRALGLPFIPPELREDDGEIEAAMAGAQFGDLVELGDIRGMVHCHTVYSDGADSVEAMARAADAMHVDYLTITDHSQSAHYAGGLGVDRLKAQWDEIARVQEGVAVRLLRGTECDILQDGSLDYPDAVLEQLDVIVASVHARHRMDEEQMTRRILRAMRHPAFKIWGHARGRLIGSRPPFACRMEEILDAIAGSRAAIEINGDPRRLDMEPRWIRAARERGIPFVISTDAHSVSALANVRYGVADRAPRVGAPPGRAEHRRGRGLPPRGAAVTRVFLLSPAHCGGLRARLLGSPSARFDLARRVRLPDGAPLGEVFTFMSGLYFRGKLAYARAFGETRNVRVITPSDGLRDPDERVDLARLARWAAVDISAGESRYREPLLRDARALARRLSRNAEVVLLGSVATGKYIEPLLEALGPRLVFPQDFVGRGDMSRGALMLRSAAAGVELEYAAVSPALHRGARPPRLAPRASGSR